MTEFVRAIHGISCLVCAYLVCILRVYCFVCILRVYCFVSTEDGEKQNWYQRSYLFGEGRAKRNCCHKSYLFCFFNEKIFLKIVRPFITFHISAARMFRFLLFVKADLYLLAVIKERFYRII